ncbi:MAG: hypothetical protein ACJAU6_001125 [Alphaproteobacteria bacterium]|jgi:hypothetical protein
MTPIKPKLFVLAVALSLTTLPVGVLAASGVWAPQASEKLMKLPGDFLKKAVENDFAKSRLGVAMLETDQKVGLKKETLADLQAAVDSAEGDLKLELTHRFLSEKKRFLELMRDQQGLRRRRAQTKVTLYEKMLRKMSVKSTGAAPSRIALAANQKAARDRFEKFAAHIDAELFRSSVTAESKYARDYAKNLTAIENLAQAINAHPMNRAPEVDGRPVSQADYLRQLIAENEADVALVDQERAILGYMAKLVSLDALALSEGVGDATAVLAPTQNPDRLTSALDFFVTR